MDILSLHIIAGIALLVLSSLRLLAVVRFHKRSRTLVLGTLATGGFQLASGVLLIAQGASVVHVCGAGALVVGFVLAIELAIRRHMAHLNDPSVL